MHGVISLPDATSYDKYISGRPLRLITLHALLRKLTLIDEHSLGRPFIKFRIPGSIAQSVTCLATDACLTADPGVASLILARSHTFVEIDHEIISTVILLPSADSFKKGCCQLQAKVCAQITD